ncbi:MAG: HAD-IC family P-type ATPase [Flavobacteriales bacterium]|nr:HAD-IC family P-type ATPase [Flavobacteriales bacterium]
MSASQSTPCYHCGDTCPNSLYPMDDHLFCCNGCRTVYSILKEGGLEQFYGTGERPGVKVVDIPAERYAYLDEPSIAEKLLLFQDDHQAKVRLYLPSIHCSSCLWLLENLYRLEESILAVKVDFAKKTALITYKKDELTLRELADILHRIGYPPHISLSSPSDSSKGAGNKDLIIKIGVTGFLFGNIMLLSFPEYVSSGIGLFERHQRIFSFLILFLSLPVIFYGAVDYFRSSWKSLRQRRLVIDVPIAIGISVIFLRSTYEILTGLGPGYLDSMAGLVFFLLIGRWYQSRVYDRLSFDKDFSSYFPLSVIRIKAGDERHTPVMDLEMGDRIKVLHQGVIPADCILTDPAMQLDYSFVTGESRAVTIQEGGLVYAGGRNLGPAHTLEVKRKVSQSYLTDLWNQPAFAKEQNSLSRILDNASGHFTLAVLGIALLTGVFWYFKDVSVLMDAVSSVLIVACPCALALSVPYALGNARRLLAEKGFFSRNTQVLESMDGIDVVVFDKTGTLTLTSGTEIHFQGEDLSPDDLQAIASLAAQSGHPHSRAIAALWDGPKREVKNFKEYAGQGVEAEIQDSIYKLGSDAYLGNARIHGAEDLSHSSVSKNGVILGSFVFQRSLRSGVTELLAQLKTSHKVMLLSGDNEGESSLFKGIFRAEEMYFNMSPEDKMRIIEDLQSKVQRVMMIGDGLNDAGALKASDVGVAIADDVDLFVPSCDVILQSARLADLCAFFQAVKRSYRVVRWSMLFSICYNLIGIGIAVQGLLTPLIAAILMPLSSVTIVLFATLGTQWSFKRTRFPMHQVEQQNLHRKGFATRSVHGELHRA